MSLGKCCADLPGSAGGLVGLAERIDASGAEGFQFLPANGKEFILGMFFHSDE
jgi:hypothetical protein